MLREKWKKAQNSVRFIRKHVTCTHTRRGLALIHVHGFDRKLCQISHLMLPQMKNLRVLCGLLAPVARKGCGWLLTQIVYQ